MILELSYWLVPLRQLKFGSGCHRNLKYLNVGPPVEASIQGMSSQIRNVHPNFHLNCTQRRVPPIIVSSETPHLPWIFPAKSCNIRSNILQIFELSLLIFSDKLSTVICFEVRTTPANSTFTFVLSRRDAGLAQWNISP